MTESSGHRRVAPVVAASDTDTAWEAWGQRDPYYGVLAEPRFRAAQMTPCARRHFFESGRQHVGFVLDTCRSRVVADFNPRRVLDFGCGVGRAMVAFATVAAEVVGVDVSPSMLAEAARNRDDFALTNALLLPSDDLLSGVDGDFDLVHSYIVLQHIPVQRGRRIFAELVKRVRRGGCGALHLTFGWDVHDRTFGTPTTPASPLPPSALVQGKRKLAKLLRLRLRQSAPPDASPALSPTPDPPMEMHFYNLSDLTFLLQQAGIPRIHVELTDHGGALGAFLFFQRPA